MNSKSYFQSNSGGNGNSNQPVYEIQEPQVSFRDYIRVLYRGRWVILISFILVMAATIYFTFTAEPVYEAGAKLMIKEQGNMGESLFDFTSMMKKETMINNQVEILKSRTLAETVIRDLKASPVADRLRLLGYQPDDVKSRFNPLGFVKRLLKGGSGDMAEELTSEEEFNNQVQALRESISVTPIRNTDMIEIKVSAFGASEAAYLANAIAEAFSRTNKEESQAEVREVRNFLEEQLKQYERDLSQSEEQLKQYQETAKVVALDQETEELVRKVAEFETLLNSAKTDMQAAHKRLDYIDAQLAKHGKSIDIETISSAPYLAELKKQIAEKEAQLASFTASIIEVGAFEDSKGEIQLKEKQIEAVKDKFRSEVSKIAASEFVDPALLSGSLITSKIEVETELQALKPKVEAFEKIVKKYNSEIDLLPEKSLKLARFKRAAQVDEKIYIMLQEKYQESRITEVGQLGNVRPIDLAKAPKFPVKPKKRLNILLGLLIGIGLGVGIAFVIEYMDNTVRTMEDVEHLNLPLMATIPYIKPDQANGVISRMTRIDDPEAADINERLVTHLKPKSPISEAYRTLRTNILFTAPENPKRVILVTSSGPREGKSTSISNLAITFAQMGSRTLLIDADLRKPMLHKLFGMEKQVGLTNVLVGKEKLESAVKRVDGMQNLDILTCGVIPPNPAELLGSLQMREMLAEAKQQYDMILIDTPPIIAVTDPSVLAGIVDGLILLIRSAVSNRDAVIHAVDQLKRVNAPLLGAILNDIQASNVYGSYYYYYHYHYYYGTDGEKKRKKTTKHKKRKHSYS